MQISYNAVKSVFLIIILFLGTAIRAQEKFAPEKILSAGQLKKYQKATYLIDKGTYITEAADSISAKRKNTKQVQRETALKKEQANLLLKDGYNMKLKVFREYLNNYIMTGNPEISNKEKATVQLSNIDQSMKRSNKLYSKAGNTPKLSNMLKYQNEAQKVQTEEIGRTESVLAELYNYKPEKQPDKDIAQAADVEQAVDASEPKASEEPLKITPVETVEETVAVPVTATAATTTEVAAATKKQEETGPVPVKEPVSGVYFTIQIMANKAPASLNKQRSVYNGTRKILQHQGDGWFRYSVGKFKSYSEAAGVMKREGIKGYIVAYKGTQRITTSEAKQLLEGTR